MWQSYVLNCRPDVVIAMSDTPYTKPPYSQKRLTKSIERSAAWLLDMLRPIPGTETPRHPNVLVQMAGGTSLAARAAFAEGLTQVFHDKEAEECKPFKCLDDGVAGYVFDLVPLRSALPLNQDISVPSSASDCCTPGLHSLIIASLNPVSHHKLRFANSVDSPHEILLLIQHIGIDLFDARWAQRAADCGVALDFRFPVQEQSDVTDYDGQRGPGTRANGRFDLGYNLYDTVYSQDFSKLAKSFLDGSHATTHSRPLSLVCWCAACSPIAPTTCISHGSADSGTCSNPPPETQQMTTEFMPPVTRAYLHHLLHTHEMSAHSLLTMHNLQVLDAFFAGVRATLAYPDGGSRFVSEVQKFVDYYDEGSCLLEEARVAWKKVDMARGKGRLAREKANAVEASVGGVAEL